MAKNFRQKCWLFVKDLKPYIQLNHRVIAGLRGRHNELGSIKE